MMDNAGLVANLVERPTTLESGMSMIVDTASTTATLHHHLGAFAEGLDAIMADYSETSVVITPEGTYRGLPAIRGFFHSFITAAPEGLWSAFRLIRQEVVGDVAYILWEARPWVLMATDTFVVRDGKIVVQTYTSHGQ